ncbi:MAG: hypothetical protein AAGE18_08075 [Pseudomonadota bacterium]
MPQRPFRSALAIAVVATTLTACVEPTPYAPVEKRDGYANKALEENRYRVSFSGNTQTSRDTVETYLLFRAAEVTLATGHDWFRIADSDTEAETSFRSTTNGFGRGGFGGGRFFRSGFRGGFFGDFSTTTTRPITRYEAFANILVFEGEKPDDADSAYDARSVIETLGGQIIRPAPG